jgi:hypothetical protein
MRPGGVVTVVVLAALAPAAWAQEPSSDNAVDARIRASAQAAESLQGPLDGAWTLVGPDGKPIYAFQIVDKPGGADPLEGVWRDLRRPSAPGDIGLIDSLQRGPGALTVSFRAELGAHAVTVVLHAGPGGAWSGDLHEAGAVIAVSMRRR